MFRAGRIFVVFLVAAFIFSGLAAVADAKSRIQLPPKERIKADQKTVMQFEELYDQIEDALESKDLDRLMSHYSDDYEHNYVTKEQLRGLWSGLFDRFDAFYSVHIFSDIKVWKNEAALTCTGVLYGKPKGGTSYEVVDSWTSVNHFLTKAGNKWKIMGGAAKWATMKKEVPGGPKYRVEFHPFF